MPNLFLFFLQNFVSPLLLICFFIVVLFAMGGADGVSVAKAFFMFCINLAVGIFAWIFRIVLTLLTIAIPALEPILNPGCGKAKGKGKVN